MGSKQSFYKVPDWLFVLNLSMMVVEEFFLVFNEMTKASFLKMLNRA